jgi:hypothetical protein
MEQQKQILYDYQLFCLQTGRRCFPSGDFSSVSGDPYRGPSGRIPSVFQNNTAMSKENKSIFLVDYIMKHWNKKDIDDAVRNANKEILKLRKLLDDKKILYDFQLLSLQTGNSGFPTTTDLIVRSGQIPPYNPSMSNELIAEYISDYIIRNWNESDIQRAVNDAQNAISVLERENNRRKNTLQIQSEQLRKKQNEQISKYGRIINPEEEAKVEHSKRTLGYDVNNPNEVKYRKMRNEQSMAQQKEYNRQKRERMTPMERWKSEKGGKRKGRKTHKKRTRKNKSRKFRK